MEQGFLDAITKILSEFASTKFASQVLELKGPVQEGMGYRWRLISTRYKEVTILLVTTKRFLGKPSPARFEVYGFEKAKELGPSLDDLQNFLGNPSLALTS